MSSKGRPAASYETYRLVPLVSDANGDDSPEAPPATSPQFEEASALSAAQVNNLLRENLEKRLLKKALTVWDRALRGNVDISADGRAVYRQPYEEGSSLIRLFRWLLTATSRKKTSGEELVEMPMDGLRLLRIVAQDARSFEQLPAGIRRYIPTADKKKKTRNASPAKRRRVVGSFPFPLVM